MASEVYSANMNMPLPGVGLTAGPQYATDLNASLTIVDQHDHSSGKGVQITPAGININSDLPISNNDITQLRSSRYTAQVSPLAASADLGCVYVSGADLYYNDTLGNQVRITQSGNVAGTPGSIGSLTSPASATYVSISSTFVWQSDASTPANMDMAGLVLRNLIVNSKGLTISPPNSMAADYSIVLPALPASQKFMTLDASGNMTAPWAVDSSTIVVASNVVKVPTSGITVTQLATDSVSTAKIVDLAVTTAKVNDLAITPPKMAARIIGLSSSCGANASTISTSYVDITNLTVTITTTGRPVVVGFTADQSLVGYILTSNDGCDIRILQDATVVMEQHISNLGASATSNAIQIPPSSLSLVYVPAAGTYVYKAQMKAITGANPLVRFDYTRLYAYEL